MADPAEIMDQMFGGESAKNRFISSTLDPQKSQRAVELEKETGIDSEAISNDVDDIDQFHKKNLAKYIIENNTKLQGYIDSHPMAAGVSQNDLGQLDNVSKKIDDLGEHKDHGIFNHAFEIGKEMFVDPWTGLARDRSEERAALREGAVQGGYFKNASDQEIENWLDRVEKNQIRGEAILGGTMLAAGWAHKLATGGFLVAAGGFREYVSEPVGEALGVGRDVIEGYVIAGLGFVGLRTMAKVEQGKQKATAKLDETLEARAKLYLDSGKAMPVGMDKQVDRAIEKVSKDYWKKIDEVAAEADKSETKELNPDFFKTFAEKHPNIAGLDVLVDAEAVKRLYGDKEPTAGDNILGFMDALPSLLRVNESIDVPIRISMAEWIAKVPSEVRKELHDDAKIKPGSVSKVEAEGLKDWNELDAWPKEEPKTDILSDNAEKFQNIVKDINDNWPSNAIQQKLQLFPDELKLLQDAGFDMDADGTISAATRIKLTNEAERVRKGISNVKSIDRDDEALRTVRQTSGLEPTSEIFDNIKAERKYGAEKLKLSRLDESARKDLDINLGSKDAFDITDEKGNVVGTLQGQKQGTNFFVDWVSSRAWAQSFGPKQVRTLIEELKREYPDLESISGNRVSGARSDTEKQGELATIKLNAPGIDQIFADAAKRGPSTNLKVGPARWDKVHPDYDLEALVKPRKFWTENETKLRLAVEKTLDKLLPEGTYKTGGAQAIRMGEVDPNGMYVQIPGEMPLILYTLEQGHNKIQTVGHEAMHYLRRKKLINDKEWEVLSKAAVDGGWVEKYEIEERYSDISQEGKLEEAIAEKLGELVRDKAGIEGAPFGDTVLKIIEFLRELRTQLKETFGRELTADDILERASSGKTGRRSLQPQAGNYLFDPGEAKAARPTQAELQKQHEDQFYSLGYERAKRSSKEYMEPLYKANDELRLYEDDLEFEGQAFADKEKAKREKLTEIYNQGEKDFREGRPDRTKAGDIKAQAKQPKKTKLPSVPADHIRFFHSGDNPTSGGGRWVNEQESYVRNYRQGESTHYVDIPNSWLDQKFPDLDLYRPTGGVTRQPYPSFEVPEQFAKQMKSADVAIKQPQQLDLPGLTRVEDQEAFKKGMDLGMTQKMLKQYMAAIEASREIDRKAIEDKALEFERKKQTKWWKDEAAKLEPEVQAELESLPDFQANEFFRTGLYGEEKLSKLPKLNPEFIDEDTLPGIPEKYLSEKGMHPDDVAGLLGINTGRALVGMLADFAEAQGDLQHAKFVDKLVRAEVDRRMEKAHGPLSENIIDWAQDHVLNNGQLELIHQEVLAAVLRAGKSELPLSKKDIEAAALDKFRQLSIGSISTESALRSLGKAQRQAVMALLDGDPVAALKHEQDRMMQFFIAREAKKLEKAGKSFMRNAERFSGREVTNFPQVYTNWIHDILMKMNTGKLNFFMEDWQKRVDIEAGGVGKESLWDFVSYKMQNDMLEIAYDDRLFDDRLRTDPVKKNFEDLTVEEFYKGHNFLKSMIHNGRMEARGDKIMEDMTHDKVVVDLVNQIALSPAKPIENAKGERVMLGGVVPLKAANIIRRAGVAHLQWEAIANRIDRGDPHGPFSTYVMRPLIEAANYVHPLEKKYAAMLKDMDKAVREKYGKQNLKEKIENTLFHEPLDKYTDPADQRPMNMTRENLRAVMLYWGSETGREKLSRGYSAHPDDIQAWIDNNATKADYMWAQEYWKVRKALKAEVDVMYQNIAGAPPEDLRLAKWITPFGDTIEGGYHPLRPHPNADMTKFGAADTFKDGLIRQNFFRATTANGHVMRRTGAVYPLDVGLDSIGTTFKQQIYDLAMRPGLIEASKYLNDDRVRIALGRHMGKEYVDMIKPYLGDVANAMNEEGASAHLAMRVFNAFRSNVIGTLVGFNPGTVMKHGPTALVQSVFEVGASNFARAIFNVWGRDHDTGKTNWKFAVETSEELQRRERNYQETLQGFNSSMLGKRPLREKFMQVAAWPVAKSDMISAVPTWLAQYEKSMVEGLTHGDSVYMADRAVRRAHGSTAVTNRPEVMRGGAAMGLLNPVYGFFSHILNRQYEMAWKAKDLAGETKRGEVSPVDFAKRSGALAGMFAAYIVAPSIIEELVSPLPSKEDEGAGEKISKALAFSVASSWIGIRDIAHFAIAGFNPSGIGVAGPAAQSMRDVVNDITSKEGKALDEANFGRTMKHAAILLGMTFGIPNAQIGRWAQLAWEYSIDKDAPDDFWTWAVALRFGQLKGHSRTPDEYAEHIMGAH